MKLRRSPFFSLAPVVLPPPRASLADIRYIVYQLLDENLLVAAPDVEAALRAQAFEASTAEVSEALLCIYHQDGLDCFNQEKLPVYAYGADSNEQPFIYLQKGALYWEASVQGRILSISKGQKGKEERTSRYLHFKNKWAVSAFYEALSARYQEGYTELRRLSPPQACYPAA